MVKVVKGTIFDSDAQTLVNTINCVGVMGKGLALEFKNRYPSMFDKYKSFCDKGVFKPGVLWIYKADDGKWILNFPTKVDWKDPSKEEYIEEGLKKFVEIWSEKGITSIAFPLLGCKNGGLDPDDIIPLMKKYLKKCEGLDVTIYDDREEIDEEKSSTVIAVVEDSGVVLKTEDESPKVVIEKSPELDPEKVEEKMDENEKGYKEEVVEEEKNDNEKSYITENKSEEIQILKHLVDEKNAMQKEIDDALNEFVSKENTPEARKEATKKIINTINRRGFPMWSVFQI